MVKFFPTNDWSARLQVSTAAAQKIAKQDLAAREEKTARLRLLRLENERAEMASSAQAGKPASH
jgi:hypothetical protein